MQTNEEETPVIIRQEANFVWCAYSVRQKRVTLEAHIDAQISLVTQLKGFNSYISQVIHWIHSA